jgi:hypothetical protein
MVVIKRSRKASASELVSAIEALIPYLKGQGEDEACEDLDKAAKSLAENEYGSDAHKGAVELVIEAFDGDHELMPYTMTRDSKGKWTEVEELSAASSRVINLARRLK